MGKLSIFRAVQVTNSIIITQNERTNKQTNELFAIQVRFRNGYRFLQRQTHKTDMKTHFPKFSVILFKTHTFLKLLGNSSTHLCLFVSNEQQRRKSMSFYLSID